jgi:hypothetical protein
MTIPDALVAAIVGAIVGGLVTVLNTWVQMRRSLYIDNDKDLRINRLAAYKSLYRRTQCLPRYWRTIPNRDSFSGWSEGFDEWYFAESGGMFLSNAARDAYHEALKQMATVVQSSDGNGSQISDDEVDRLWRAGQDLRRQLAADIGSSASPRIRYKRPSATPPALVRMSAHQTTPS